MSQRRSRPRGRDRRKRTALFVIILAEAIFITVVILSGFIPRLVSGGGGGGRPTTQDIVRYMLATLINPRNGSFVNPIRAGFINNTRPIAAFIVIDDWRMAYMTCDVWNLLNKSRSLGWRVLLIVLPSTLNRPADETNVHEFLRYTVDICGIDVSRITNETYTAFWHNVGRLYGLQTLLALLAAESGHNMTIALPALVFIGKNDTLKALYMGESVLNATIPLDT